MTMSYRSTSSMDRNIIETFGQFQAFIKFRLLQASLFTDCSSHEAEKMVHVSFVSSPHGFSVERLQKDFLLALGSQKDHVRDRHINNNENEIDDPDRNVLHKDETSTELECLNLDYYLVISSCKIGEDLYNIFAIYQIVHNFKFDDLCPDGCYHQLEINKKDNIITVKGVACKEQCLSSNSNVYLLRLDPNVEQGIGSIDIEFDLLFESRFEFHLFIQALQAISALICMNSIRVQTQNDAKISPLSKKRKSGIIIKARKVESSTNSYSIIGCSMDVTSCKNPLEESNKKQKMELDESHQIQSNNGSNDKYKVGDKFVQKMGNFDISIDSKDSFYFVEPIEKSSLTDYMFVLMTQVKRGQLTSKDRDNARRKNSAIEEGYLGLRCRHCGGYDRGHYFPTTCKNLQACPSMIYKHLMSCKQCPQELKQLLKAAKTKHKTQVLEKETGAQIGFFNTLWQRIHDKNFTGGDAESRIEILNIVKRLYNALSFDTSSSLKSQLYPEDIDTTSPNLSTSEAKDFDFRLNPAKDNLIMTREKIMSTHMREKHVNEINHIPLFVRPPALPDISIDPSKGHITSAFEAQSLNVTLDMLDAFAGEILNATPYTYPYLYRAGNRTKVQNTCSLIPVNSGIQWDQPSLNAIKTMVESDDDYREMIDILLNLNTSDDNIVPIGSTYDKSLCIAL